MKRVTKAAWEVLELFCRVVLVIALVMVVAFAIGELFS